jgi:DNA-binding transcriptional regulator GbsR (MarR family)
MKTKIRTMSEMARILGISRQAMSKLVRDKERTGAPIRQDIGGTYFNREETVAWYAARPKRKKS